MNSILQQSQRLIGTAFIAVALFGIVGGHWAVLQGVAWTRMVHTYSAEGSLQSAVEKTFSGKHPCSLCKKIACEKQKEKKAAATLEKISKKTEGILEKVVYLQTPSPRNFYYPKFLDSTYGNPVIEPLLPPPRAALLRS